MQGNCSNKKRNRQCASLAPSGDGVKKFAHETVQIKYMYHMEAFGKENFGRFSNYPLGVHSVWVKGNQETSIFPYSLDSPRG